jgi:hypothetical protein
MRRLTTICIGSIVIGLMLAGPSHALVDPDTILGAWLLDEGTGDTTADASGNGHDGTLVGSPAWVMGAFGNALEFDGSSTHVTCGAPAEFNVDVFSVSFWCYIPNTQGWNHMISRGSHVASGTPGSVNWGVMMYSAQETILYETFNDTGWVGINTPAPAGEWHHVVATLDVTAMQLFLDGELAATASGGVLLDESRAFIIGALSDAGSVGGFFDGSLDDVGYFNAILSEEDVQTIMNQGLAEIVGGTAEATNPQPALGASDVPLDVTMEWTPGMFAVTHDVYVGTSFDDVSSASRDNPLDVLVSEGQPGATYQSGMLDFAQTYYWRVDEVNGAPDNTIFKGLIWSFTAEPFAYPIANITATASHEDAGATAANTVNGSGLDADDLHGIDASDMWLASPAPNESVWIQYEFDNIYKLHEMLVWNYNVQFELILGFGLKDVTVEYSIDGTEWIPLGDVQLAQGMARADYAANSTVSFDGIAARYVRLNVDSGWGMLGQFGLSEVRFMYIPALPREPQPADGATDVDVTATIAWRSGRDTTTHEVYFGTDPAALPLAGTPATAQYDPGALDLGATYYWQITEVQDGESWQGDLWSFSTRQYLVVEDFERYDDEENVIYETWIDGWVNETGSTVGYLEAPFAERTIVRNGRQSMPLFYDNAGVTTSEADFELTQNWATNGIQSLSLYFYGDPDATVGQLYVKINGTKVSYDGDTADLNRAAWQPWNIDLSTVGNVSSVSSLTIGIEGAGASGVIYIDDIRLYPLAPAPIVPAEPDAANLVASYGFEGNANDGSGNGHNGTVIGDITFVSDPGRGQVVSLPGGDDQYISIEGVGISGNMPRTIACWAKADSTSIPDWTLIFGFTGDAAGEGGNGSHFNIGSLGGPGGVGAHCWGWEETIFTDQEALEWHHYAMSYDGTTIRYYGDGVPMDTDPAKSNVQDLSISSDRVHVGSRITQTSSFPGQVDDAVIYGVTLTDEEVAWLAGRRGTVHRPF